MTDPDNSNLSNETLGKKFRSWLASVPVGSTIVVSAVLVVTVVALLLAVNGLRSHADQESRELLGNARHFEGPETEIVIKPIGPSAVAERLQAHLDDVRAFAFYHSNAARTFFVYQYVSITIATVAAVLAGLLLVPISWTGWKGAKPLLSLPFFLAAGTAILFTTFNQLYKHEENIRTNTVLYFGYLALEDEILSFYPRLEASREKQEETVPEPHVFLKSIEDRLKTMRTLGVVLDASSIPEFQEVFEAVSKASEDSAGQSND